VAKLGKSTTPSKGLAGAVLSGVTKFRTSDNLLGRTFMLNTAVATKFQCGGFTVGPLRPFATVTSETQQEQIRHAVADGKLVDITGTDLAKGIKTKHGSTSEIKEEDTGKRVFVGQDARGNLYIVTPKTKTEQKKLEREIKKTGTIKANYAQAYSQVSSLSPIITEELPQEPPAHGNSQRRIRKSRRSKH
jgi:hypothetical protein